MRDWLSRTAPAAPALLLIFAAIPAARADAAAANACAAKLAKDARTIYDATLPQLTPGADLRALVTTNTRALARAGTIDRGTARQSAQAAGACLQRARR